MINFKKVTKTLDLYKSQFESQKQNHLRLSKHISQNPKDIDAIRNRMLLEGRMFYVNHNINLLTSRAKIAINK
jgi:ribosomal protein S15P/S13E